MKMAQMLSSKKWLNTRIHSAIWAMLALDLLFQQHACSCARHSKIAGAIETGKLEAKIGRSWPSHYTREHRELHDRLASTTHSHLEDFEVVVPARVDHRFAHVTHVVRHSPPRARRDVADTLRYVVAGFDERFHLELEEPNTHLLAPGFRVTRRKRSAEVDEDRSASWGCHYHGRVVSHGGRMAAVSTCDGLTGFLRVESDDVIIEPVPVDVNHSFASPRHPHVMYKRRHLRTNKSSHLEFCGKGRRHPVAIPDEMEGKTIKLLSNGEIELESGGDGQGRGRVRRSAMERRRDNNDIGAAIDSFRSQLPPLSGTAHRPRPRRKQIETLVVADRTMIGNHARNRRDITTYVLTVMNMVSSLFTDRSLDEELKVVIVGLILLEDDEELNLGHRADKSLLNFCQWQSTLNHTTGQKPDHAILLTGIDICVNKNKPCGTLGLAQIGGMCRRQESCTINEDMGLGLAFTVAHETGHSLGMRHDGQGNLCSTRDGNIMSPTLNGRNGVFTWSQCSRRALVDFIRSDDSVCLDNHPGAPIAHLSLTKRELPGQTYDADSQCKWQFGPEHRVCTARYLHPQTTMCKILWCQRADGDHCQTKYMPAAEGTSCGFNMWCRRGSCVDHGTVPLPVDGGWSEYDTWSACTRTCGGGVRLRRRTCSQPAPTFGGVHCMGDDKEYQMCNTQKCEDEQITFRALQCAAFDSKPYRRRFYKWLPFTKFSSFGRGQCELLCKAEGYGFFDMLADKAMDGTPCEENSICIDGKCTRVGCDHVIGSNATRDACGVCNGDTSSCTVVKGRFDNIVYESGYYSVVRIPQGARNIKISEDRCCTHSYVAIRSGTDSKYYLNGNWEVSLFGVRNFAGAEWTYNRKPFRSEDISSTGPVTEDLVIEVLVVTENPGISYSYTMQLLSETYSWQEIYSNCSKYCANGTRSSTAHCVRESDREMVPESNCDQSTKPHRHVKICNLQDCPARWEFTEWSTCSRTCDGGLQSRQVACKVMSASGEVHKPDYSCDISIKPTRTQRCQVTACPANWHVGAWSKCSRQCGRGVRTRPVYCKSSRHRSLKKSRCDAKTRPVSKQQCLVSYCRYKKYQWSVSAWSKCTATCGKGEERRRSVCMYKTSKRRRATSPRRCKRLAAPTLPLVRSCSAAKPCVAAAARSTPAAVQAPTSPPPTSVIAVTSSWRRRTAHRSMTYDQHRAVDAARWKAESWQKCTASCGGGVQVRSARCVEGGRAANTCLLASKPSTQQACNTFQCVVTPTTADTTKCTDKYSWCKLVPQHHQCGHPYFGKQCCATCSQINKR